MSGEKHTMASNIAIKVNGVEMSLNPKCTISDYLLKAEISGRFIVIVNEQIVPKNAYSITVLNDGDQLDMMSPISGG